MRVLDGVIRVEWSFHKKRKGGGLNFYLNEGSAKTQQRIKVSRTPPLYLYTIVYPYYNSSIDNRYIR